MNRRLRRNIPTAPLWLLIVMLACQRPVAYRATGDDYTPSYALDKEKADIQRFAALDAARMPAPGGVVLAGSSSFRLWPDAARDLSPLPIINRGFGGSTLPEVIHYLDETVLRYRPAMVVVYCENDMFVDERKTPAQTRDAYVELTRRVRARLPGVQLYFVSIKPSPSRWSRRAEIKEANALIKKFIQKDMYHGYIDVWPAMLKDGRPDSRIFLQDSLHMNAEGYRRWTEIIKPVLQKSFKP